MTVPVISFVGTANSGKTTYLEKLIAEMKLRSFKVAIIKHHGEDFEIDIPGKDTWRHAQAGADIVCLSSPHKLAIIKKVERDLNLAEVAETIDGVDIIFTEGYKKQNALKIEVFRQAISKEPVCKEHELLAMVTDVQIYDSLPSFDFSNVVPMADFLESNIIREIGG